MKTTTSTTTSPRGTCNSKNSMRPTTKPNTKNNSTYKKSNTTKNNSDNSATIWKGKIRKSEDWLKIETSTGQKWRVQGNLALLI